ncbi:hypothetical protein PVNG_02833 [Plasmodium vivax North Korean]|uniref:Variable surface protein n=1 Tax=Plasmodium vivax North Korean TaxID=1035514 RepID=A0A0J9TL15_PLAVI|nr:hypothetical protein PVNG_02833 [Plasmodium vivax North Korean]
MNANAKEIGIGYININLLNRMAENFYSIFNDVESYIKKANEAESKDVKHKLSKECSKFLNEYKYSNIKLYVLCEQFKYIYNYFTSLKHKSKHYISYNKDCKYMNYWLNDKLKKFFNKIKEYDNNFDKDNYLLKKIYKLDDDVLENMRILYNLFHKYYKIHDILEGKAEIQEKSCLSYFVQCVNEYKNAKIKCFMNNNYKL